MNETAADRMKGRKFRQTTEDMNAIKVEIPLQAVPIEKKEIAFTLGYTDGNLPPHFEEIIDEVIRRTPEVCNLQTGFRILDIGNTSERRTHIQIGELQFITRELVAAQLQDAEKIALFLCSIGSGMEEWSRESAGNGDPALSFFIDAIASVIVESAVDVLHRYLGEYFLEQGLKVTNRYSPGYCDWPVDEQQKLFSLLPKRFCGVALTESALMIPIKSISGIIGVGEKVKYRRYSCDACGRKDCTYKAFRKKRSIPMKKGNRT